MDPLFGCNSNDFLNSMIALSNSFLINKFINDLEQASIELGFGETGLKKEVRKLAKNFYNNLDFNLQIINKKIFNLLKKNIIDI